MKRAERIKSLLAYAKGCLIMAGLIDDSSPYKRQLQKRADIATVQAIRLEGYKGVKK